MVEMGTLAHAARSLRSRLMAFPRIRSYEFISPEKKVELLRAEGLEIRPVTIDPAAVDDFRSRCDYAGHYPATPADKGLSGSMVYREKSLEHYLSYTLLKPARGEVLVDVASSESPFADNVARLSGCRAYMQDLIFPEGVHGTRIGGSAAAMPLPDDFADAISLNCSFEHFEGDNDIGFIGEAARILVPGGRMCILPLYMESRHLHVTSRRLWAPGIPRDPGARWHFLSDGRYNSRFGRLYSPRAFLERLEKPLAAFTWEIVRFENVQRLYPDLWCSLALLARSRKEARTRG